jgi:hypothetical protein
MVLRMSPCAGLGSLRTPPVLAPVHLLHTSTLGIPTCPRLLGSAALTDGVTDCG